MTTRTLGRRVLQLAVAGIALGLAPPEARAACDAADVHVGLARGQVYQRCGAPRRTGVDRSGRTDTYAEFLVHYNRWDRVAGIAPLGAGRGAGVCSRTAKLQLAGCLAEITDDRFVGQAICLNLTDQDEAEECREDLSSDFEEARELCFEQNDARRELCEELGEDRYDPSFDSDDFETEFTNLNHHFPLAVGNSWRYENEDETITVTVLDETKQIDGVTCIVVRDVVEEDGALIEDTNDWYGQRSDGTVDYCGEEAKDYETFEGDVPPLPELVEIEGSFKAGRDGDKPGTLFLGPMALEVGRKYRQEWSPSNAEDVAEVLATEYGPGRPDARFDGLVPEELFEIMCGDDHCVVTEDTTPLEPDVVEYKFYAYGVGVFLEIKPEDGEATPIVECDVQNAVGDAKCDALPDPED